MSKSVDSKSAAPFAFSVGVVGHRPNRLKAQDVPSLTARLGEALDLVKQTAKRLCGGPVYLTAVSPLAEGTDRYFATEAIRLGYKLHCPLPFRKSEFEKDFKPGHSLLPGTDSVEEFNEILDSARAGQGLALTELDGKRAKASAGYAAAGKKVLKQSDLLIVVWDGRSGNKTGGTYETLEEALDAGLPVLWIDARAPHPWKLLHGKDELPACSRKRCVPATKGKLDLSAVVARTLKKSKSKS
jgi:hypothetical protein